MDVKLLFILGRPGSGKTTAVHHIRDITRNSGWFVDYINDYDILYSMFEEDLRSDAEQKRFKPVIYEGLSGFYVSDFHVLNEALVQIKTQIHHLTRPLTASRLVLIEFARGSYRRTLRQFFGHDLLKDAYFLFIDVDIETCIARATGRVRYRPPTGFHYVPEDAIRTYYSDEENDIPSIAESLGKDYDIDMERVKVLGNTFASLRFFKEVYRFTRTILKDTERKTEDLPAFSVSIPTSKLAQNHSLPETGPIPKALSSQPMNEREASL